MGLTREISEFLVRRSGVEFTNSEIQAAKTLILDVVGACVSAANEPVTQMITSYVKESGGTAECSVLGQRFKTSLGHAAFINGARGTQKFHESNP